MEKKLNHEIKKKIKNEKVISWHYDGGYTKIKEPQEFNKV